VATHRTTKRIERSDDAKKTVDGEDKYSKPKPSMVRNWNISLWEGYVDCRCVPNIHSMTCVSNTYRAQDQLIVDMVVIKQNDRLGI
jgi:hypothetical protein